jgi:hypothetical protein
VYNLCAHTVRMQREASPVKEYKSDGIWQCKPLRTPRLEDVLGLPCYSSCNFSEFELESLPLTLPLDAPVILIVSTDLGRAIERINYCTAKRLLQDHPHVTIVSQANGGLDECSRLQSGQIDVSFVWKQHTPGSMHQSF